MSGPPGGPGAVQPGGARDLRLFVAAGVDEAVRAELDRACRPLRAAHPGVSWSAAATWHLTLAFLGATPPERVPAAAAALAAAASAARPFAVALTGRARTFRGSVLWAELDDCPQLDALAAGVRAALADAGFAQHSSRASPRAPLSEDRPFRAHLTLGRARRGARIAADVAGAFQGPVRGWPVAAITLFSSRLGRGGAQHTELSTWPLGPGAARPVQDA